MLFHTGDERDFLFVISCRSWSHSNLLDCAMASHGGPPVPVVELDTDLLAEVHVVCRVCNCKVQAPRLLPCLHTICRVCIDSLALDPDPKRPGKRFSHKCPHCQATFNLPNGEADLPLDVSMGTCGQEKARVCALCKPSNTTVTRSRKEKGRKKVVDEPKRLWQCDTCKVAMCGDHLAQHMKESAGVHTIRECVAQEDSERWLPYALCKEHGAPLDHYCVGCAEEVCEVCHDYGKHKDHDPVFPAKAFLVEEMLLVQEKTEELRDETIPSLHSSIASVKDAACSLEARTYDVRKRIAADRERAKKAIDHCFAKRLRDVKELKFLRKKLLARQHVKLTRHLENVEHALSFRDRLFSVKRPNDDMAANLTALKRRVVSLGEVKFPSKAVCHGHVSFSATNVKRFVEKVDESIGQVYSCTGSALHSVISGNEANPMEVSANDVVQLFVDVKDEKGVDAHHGGDSVDVVWTTTPARCSSEPPCTTVDHIENGTYEISFCLAAAGSYVLAIRVNGEEMAHRVKITCRSNRRCYYGPVRFDEYEHGGAIEPVIRSPKSHFFTTAHWVHSPVFCSWFARHGQRQTFMEGQNPFGQFFWREPFYRDRRRHQTSD